MSVARLSVLLPLAIAATLVAPAGASASALKLSTCREDAGFACGALSVPLDHSGAVPGRLKIAIAAQKHYPKGAGLLIALSGGPGQSSVSAASSFAVSLQPALKRYRLVVLDQRGTGLSSLLDCPKIQNLGALDPFVPQDILSCEQKIGARRSFFATKDSVEDLDAIRTAFGAKKIAVMGVSYGTWVGLEYARAHPAHTDRLILDSVVGPDRPDAFFLDSYRTLPRIMREQCAGTRCKGVTKDPVGDLAALLERIRKEPISGPVYDSRGRRHKVTYRTEEQLSFLITGADLNPFMQARLPGAIAAERKGDPAALLRLRRIAEGPPTRSKDLSFALNVTTSCLDASLPWPADSDPSVRPALSAAALAAVPPADYAPWSAETVRSSSYADDCLQFPRQAAPQPPELPLPDVPALILAGRLDMRTPVENARATAARLPRSSIVEVPGNGHDQLDTDATNCATNALTRFIDHQKVRPCNRHRTDQQDVLPVPPLKLSEFRRPGAVGGDRGRTLFAVMDTVADARVSALEAVYAGWSPRGGGLRGGHFRADDGFAGRLELDGYSYLPGLRLTGHLLEDGAKVQGRISVAGRYPGFVQLASDGSATGRLGGRAFRYRVSRASSAAAGARSHRVDGSAPARIPGVLPPALSARGGR